MDNIVDEQISYLESELKAPNSLRSEFCEAIRSKLEEHHELVSHFEESRREIEAFEKKNNSTISEYFKELRPEELISEANRELLGTWDVRGNSWKAGVLIEHVLCGQSFFLKGLSREEVLSKLSSWHSPRRVDTLTCWAWIKEHERMINENAQNLYKPFQCEDGPPYGPNQPRMRLNVDREFSTLRLFLPKYNEVIGSEYNFSVKRERPDFILDLHGQNPIGVEITDAEPRAHAHGTEWEILEELFHENGIKPILYSGLDLAGRWGDKRDDMRRVFNAEILPHFQSGQNCIRKDVFGITIEVRPKSHCTLWNTGSNNTGYLGYYLEEQNVEAIFDKIKIKCNGKPPKVKPCILVIRPVHDFPIGHHDCVQTLVKDRLNGINIRDHFDEIWYAYEGNRQIYKLLP